MERIRRRWRDRTRADQQWQAPLAVALQFAQAIYLVGSLFQGIAYQPFMLTLIGRAMRAVELVPIVRFAAAQAGAHKRSRAAGRECRSGTCSAVALGRFMRL